MSDIYRSALILAWTLSFYLLCTLVIISLSYNVDIRCSGFLRLRTIVRNVSQLCFAVNFYIYFLLTSFILSFNFIFVKLAIISFVSYALLTIGTDTELYLVDNTAVISA